MRTTRWWNYSSERRKEKEEEKIKIESGRGTHDSNKGVGERKGGKTGGLVTRDVNIRLCDYAFDEHGEGTTVFIRQRPRIPFIVHSESNSRVDLGYGARKCWSMGVKVSVYSPCLGGGGWIEINRSERREFDRNLSENFGYHC